MRCKRGEGGVPVVVTLLFQINKLEKEARKTERCTSIICRQQNVFHIDGNCKNGAPCLLYEDNSEDSQLLIGGGSGHAPLAQFHQKNYCIAPPINS